MQIYENDSKHAYQGSARFLTMIAHTLSSKSSVTESQTRGNRDAGLSLSIGIYNRREAPEEELSHATQNSRG